MIVIELYENLRRHDVHPLILGERMEIIDGTLLLFNLALRYTR